MATINAQEVTRFEELKDLITRARQVCLEEHIRNPTLILSPGWDWLKDDAHSFLFLMRATRAAAVKWTAK